MSKFAVSHRAKSMQRLKPIPQSLTFFSSSQDLQTSSPYRILRTNYQTPAGYVEGQISSANHQTPSGYVVDIVLGTRHQVPTTSVMVWVLRANHRSPTIHPKNNSLLAICYQSLSNTHHAPILQVRWSRRSDVSPWSFIRPSLSPFSNSGAEHYPFTIGLRSRVTILS